MVEHYDLNEAIETGLFLLPEVPGELTAVSIPGVLGRRTNISHRLANTIGAATLDEQTADKVIQEVIQTFASQGQTFGWRVGPYSTPKDLGQRLLAAGLTKEKTLAGLFFAEWQEDPFQIPNHITIRQASPADTHLLEALILESYQVHASWADTMSKALLPSPGGAKVRNLAFLAFVAGNDSPVGMASMYALPEQPVVFFGGASILPNYRRQGIYSSLVTHRLKAAKQNGARAAVIQAVEQSAEGCKKLGFTKFCEIDAFTWKQET